MISVKELIDEVDFDPEVLYLHDGEKDIKINYASLKENFGYNLDCFLELVQVDGKVYFSKHSWKNETDVHLDTSVLETLKQIDDGQFGQSGQKISHYFLLVQNALEDLKFGDVEGISELTVLLETNVVEI